MSTSSGSWMVSDPTVLERLRFQWSQGRSESSAGCRVFSGIPIWDIRSGDRMASKVDRSAVRRSSDESAIDQSQGAGGSRPSCPLSLRPVVRRRNTRRRDKDYRTTDEIDEQQQLRANVRVELRVGPVRLIVLPEEDANSAWTTGVAKEWANEMSDPREDVYDLDDGQPLDETR